MAKEKMNLRQKLSAIQNELKAPKNQRNNFGKYNYRSAEDILEAAKPLCYKYNTCLVVSDELVNIGERYYINAEAVLFDNESDNTISANGYAREEENKKGMDGSQITGASSSYSRKYALNGLFNIDDTKDSDATNDGSKEVKKPSSKPKQKTATEDDKKQKLIKAFSDNKEKTISAMKSKGQKLSRAQANVLVSENIVTKEEIADVVK